MRRTGVWVSVFRNFIIHEIFSEFVQPFPYVGIIRVSPYLLVGFVFSWVLDFWLAQSTGLSVLAFQPVYLTQLRDRNLSHTGLPRACLVTLSLDTVEDVMVGEVDELEEDVGRSISCLEGEGKLEEEPVDKPGTTIGTKVSVLHCIRIPFSMRCGFWPLIHSYEYPCSSQSFPSGKTAGESSRTFIVKNITNSLTNCGLFMRLHFTIGCYNRRRTSRCRHGFHFSGIRILFADHVHRRSGVCDKFSFLRFKGWQAPIFRRWEECSFIFLL